MRVVKLLPYAPYSITTGGSIGIVFTPLELEELGLSEDILTDGDADNTPVFIVKYTSGNSTNRFFPLSSHYLEDITNMVNPLMALDKADSVDPGGVVNDEVYNKMYDMATNVGRRKGILYEDLVL